MLAYCIHKIRMHVTISEAVIEHHRVVLAWRRSMDHVKAVKRICHSVGLVELIRVILLWHDIHADHLKASVMVAFGTAASTAKQIEQSWFIHHATPAFRLRAMGCSSMSCCGVTFSACAILRMTMPCAPRYLAISMFMTVYLLTPANCANGVCERCADVRHAFRCG